MLQTFIQCSLWYSWTLGKRLSSFEVLKTGRIICAVVQKYELLVYWPHCFQIINYLKTFYIYFSHNLNFWPLEGGKPPTNTDIPMKAVIWHLIFCLLSFQYFVCWYRRIHYALIPMHSSEVGSISQWVVCQLRYACCGMISFCLPFASLGNETWLPDIKEIQRSKLRPF